MENARLKARHYAARSGLLTAAEDSGLVIDALGGDPGVRSARFLRPDASYAERFAEISRRLSAAQGAPRAARFVCALAVARQRDIVFETEGTIEGEVLDVPRGSAGFGYDPIFFYPPYGRTLAEVAEDEKLRVAHRGVAFRRLSEWLGRM
jgi:XTP/dITP diphosphohydrolase